MKLVHPYMSERVLTEAEEYAVRSVRAKSSGDDRTAIRYSNYAMSAVVRQFSETSNVISVHDDIMKWAERYEKYCTEAETV